MVDLKTLRRLSQEIGIGPRKVEKELMLLELLRKFSEIRDGFFIWKGGTAINKAYLGSLQRMSEDLDFDYFSESKTPQDDLRKLLTKISTDTARLDEKVIHNVYAKTVFFSFSFDSAYEIKDKVRFDINYGTKEPVLEYVRAKVSTYYRRQEFEVQTYSFEALIAQKIKTLSDRREGRDMYDLAIAFEKNADFGKIRTNLKKLCAYQISEYSAVIKKSIDTLRMANPLELAKRTNLLIPEDARPYWAELKKKLTKNLELLK